MSIVMIGAIVILILNAIALGINIYIIFPLISEKGEEFVPLQILIKDLEKNIELCTKKTHQLLYCIEKIQSYIVPDIISEEKIILDMLNEKEKEKVVNINQRMNR